MQVGKGGGAAGEHEDIRIVRRSVDETRAALAASGSSPTPKPSSACSGSSPGTSGLPRIRVIRGFPIDGWKAPGVSAMRLGGHHHAPLYRAIRFDSAGSTVTRAALLARRPSRRTAPEAAIRADLEGAGAVVTR